MELDHIFVLCDVGAPEAALLTSVGLREGRANTHPGQGTACRRFFFQSAYLELVWVHDTVQAQGAATRRTRLWDRWAARNTGACPFGVVFRPARREMVAAPPFPTWSYAPAYLPPGLTIEVATDTPLTEPEFFYLSFQRDRALLDPEPVAHAIPVVDIASVRIDLPPPGPRSAAARKAEALGLLSFEESRDYTLTLIFDDDKGHRADLRPGLPLVLRW